MTHTATPWTVWTDDDHWSDKDEIYIVGNPTGENGGMRKLALMIPTYADQAKNAEFIVTACNAHDDLVAALRDITRAYRAAVKLHDSNTDDAFTVAAHNALAKAGQS